MILEPKKRKSVTASIFPPSICHEVIGTDAMVLVFYCWISSQLSHSSLSPSSKGSLVPLHFLPLEWYHLHIWGCWYFSQQSWFQLVIHPAGYFTWCTLHRTPAELFLENGMKVLVAQSCPTLCNSRDCSSPGTSVHGKNRVGCHSLLQGILLTHGLNPGITHCRQILCCLSHQGSHKTEPINMLQVRTLVYS